MCRAGTVNCATGETGRDTRKAPEQYLYQHPRVWNALYMLAIFLLTLLLNACAVSGESPPTHGAAFEIVGVRIFNQLESSIADAQILVLQTGSFVSCSSIQPATSCSTSFPGREYGGGPMRVTWKEQGLPQATDDFALKTEAFATSARPLWVEVVIFAPGQAGARLVQRDPGQ
jgi:hypothetical protein